MLSRLLDYGQVPVLPLLGLLPVRRSDDEVGREDY